MRGAVSLRVWKAEGEAEAAQGWNSRRGTASIEGRRSLQRAKGKVKAKSQHRSDGSRRRQAVLRGAELHCVVSSGGGSPWSLLEVLAWVHLKQALG